MAYQQSQQPKSVGSIYVNLPKTATGDDKQTIADICDTLNAMKAYFSISMKNTAGGYDKFSGFVNNYKKDDKSPHFIIRETVVSRGTAPTKSQARRFASQKTQRFAPQPQENIQEDEGFPL